MLVFSPARCGSRVGAGQPSWAVGLALLLLGWFNPQKPRLTTVTKENFTEQLVMKGKQICWQQSWGCEVEWG